MLGGITVDSSVIRIIGYKGIGNGNARIYTFNKAGDKYYKVQQSIVHKEDLRKLALDNVVNVNNAGKEVYYILRENSNSVDYFNNYGKVQRKQFNDMYNIAVDDPSQIVNQVDCFNEEIKLAKIIGRERIVKASNTEIIGEILVGFGGPKNEPIYSTYKLVIHEDGYMYLEKYIITCETIIVPRFASIVSDGAFVTSKEDHDNHIVNELRVCKNSLLEIWNNAQLKDLITVDFSGANHLKSIYKEQFSNCYNLTTFKIHQNNPIILGDRLFDGQLKLSNVQLDCQIGYLGVNAFRNTCISQLSLKMHSKLSAQTICGISSLRKLVVEFYNDKPVIESGQIQDNFNLSTLSINQIDGNQVSIQQNQIVNNSQLSDICLPDKVQLDPDWLKDCQRVSKIYNVDLKDQCKVGDVRLRVDHLNAKQLCKLNNIQQIYLYTPEKLTAYNIIGAIRKLPRLKKVIVNNKLLQFEEQNILDIQNDTEDLVTYMQLKFLNDSEISQGKYQDNVCITSFSKDASIALKVIINQSIEQYIVVQYVDNGKIHAEVVE